jgi:hypothetical protein
LYDIALSAAAARRETPFIATASAISPVLWREGERPQKRPCKYIVYLHITH